MSAEQRRALMARIRSTDTAPELVVRRLAYALGYRFRLHRKGLPGKPDLVFPSRHCVVFVHGCFWHGHSCTLASKPKTNASYWAEKISANRARDYSHIRALRQDGWRVAIVWECETRRKDLAPLADTLRYFLDFPKREGAADRSESVRLCDTDIRTQSDLTFDVTTRRIKQE